MGIAHIVDINPLLVKPLRVHHMLPEEFDKIAFEREYNFFYDYLENMEKFLEIEIQKHLENLDEIIQKRKKLDETVSSANSGKLPVEMEYDFSKLNRLGIRKYSAKIFFYHCLYFS